MKTFRDMIGMRALVDRLNYLTKKYDEGHPEVSDKEWDELYFKLVKMESQSGNYYPDSPTRQINYQVVNELKKVEHNHKMLSLDKTKDLDDVIKFIGKQDCVIMAKLDGLTCSLRYLDGKLVSAETRGNGVIGEDVLHNAMVIPSIPKRIDYQDELIVDGEIICMDADFQEFAAEYKNPRNFAAGSIRLLDAKECEKRNLTFVAWDVIKGFDDIPWFLTKLINAYNLGFKIVPYEMDKINEESIGALQVFCMEQGYPIDGLVFKFNNIAYGKAQGETAHHFKNAIAYKFYDELYPTTLKDIEWSMGRTGVLTPVAVFEPVEIEGATVERASLHNYSILKETLGTPWRGQPIGVFKANMIIPQIGEADLETIPEKEKIIRDPATCPVCGSILIFYTPLSGPTIVKCSNDECEGQLINRLDHFCGKKGLDIKGLSKATLEKLIEWGWVNNLSDIFSLKDHLKEWVVKPGFGEKSVEKILDSIEASKNCSFEAFLASLGIPLIGRTVSAELVKHFSTYEELSKAIDENYDFTKLPGFAQAKQDAIMKFDYTEADKLYGILEVQPAPTIIEAAEQPLKDKKFVITGTVSHFKNRAELQQFIEKLGGKVVSSISKNVDYLINNNVESTSAKNVAAKKMGIPILTEEEFLEKIS